MGFVATPQETIMFRESIGMNNPESYFNGSEKIDCVGLSLIAMSNAFIKKGKIPMVRVVRSSPIFPTEQAFGHLYVTANSEDYGVNNSRGTLSYSRGFTTSEDAFWYPDLEPEVLSSFPDFRRNILHDAFNTIEKPNLERVKWIHEHPEYIGIKKYNNLNQSLASLLLSMANQLKVIIF